MEPTLANIIEATIEQLVQQTNYNITHEQVRTYTQWEEPLSRSTLTHRNKIKYVGTIYWYDTYCSDINKL